MTYQDTINTLNINPIKNDKELEFLISQKKKSKVKLTFSFKQDCISDINKYKCKKNKKDIELYKEFNKHLSEINLNLNYLSIKNEVEKSNKYKEYKPKDKRYKINTKRFIEFNNRLHQRRYNFIEKFLYNNYTNEILITARFNEYSITDYSKKLKLSYKNTYNRIKKIEELGLIKLKTLKKSQGKKKIVKLTDKNKYHILFEYTKEKDFYYF